MSMQVLGPTPYFWQWDTGRKLEVSDVSCGEVHFCNGTGDCALVVAIKTQADGTRTVDVPNILLQTARPIRAYLFQRHDDGAETRTQYDIQVLPRSRPDSYVYEETEVLDYAHLDKRLTDLEGEGLAKAVAAYLEENPVQTGATEAEAAQIQQNKEDIEKLSTDKLDAAALPDAVNDALAQAKESGEFKGDPGDPGQPGYTPVKGVDYFDGEPGQPGAPGDDYVITPDDYAEIAKVAAGLVEVPEASMKPLTFTGAVNATYDGSEGVTVEIPQSGGGESKKWVHIAQIDITEDTNKIYITEDVDGNPFEVENIHAFFKAVKRTDDISAVRVMKILYHDYGGISENSSMLYGALIQHNNFGNKNSDKYYYYESVVVGNYRKLNAVESNATFTNAITAAAPSVYEDGTTISTIKENATVDGIIVAAVNGFKVGDTIDIWGI